ncbi:MAG: DUF1385 domain-containing protein [Clostridia bacterium]|nr:DUF1385 domain-containing protein [Clostridia bacterium]
MSKNKTCYLPEKRGKVGGQAVLEGVMMKSGDNVSLTVRKEDGSMVTKNSKFVAFKTRSSLFSIPVIRGVVNFIDSMRLSFSTLGESAEMMGIDEDMGDSKFERWLSKTFGDKIMNAIMTVAMVLAVVLFVVLFFWLPTFLTNLLEMLTGDLGMWKSVVEGAIKIGIFVAYLSLVSLMKDIRRTFEYHGAEHKSIFCYEAGKELTVENVREQSRFHPRCGTSFMFVMLALSIISGMFIPWHNQLLRVICKLLMLPLVMGIGYEFLMYAGKHDNFIVRVLSAPGLWMQRITTREPDDSQIECAIASLKAAMPEEFPPEAAEEAEAEKAEETEADETENSEEK